MKNSMILIVLIVFIAGLFVGLGMSEKWYKKVVICPAITAMTELETEYEAGQCYVYIFGLRVPYLEYFSYMESKGAE